MSNFANEQFIVRALIGLYLVIGILWIGLIYGLSARNGTLESHHFFPSKVMESDPERMLGSLFLPFIAAISALFIALRLRRMQRLLEFASKPKLAHSLFYGSIGLLVLSSISMVGLGAISLGASAEGHWTLAFIFFVSTPFLLVFVNTLDDLILLERPRWLTLLRLANTSLIFVIAIVMAATRSNGPAFSALELLVIILFTTYFLSFAHGSDFVMKSVAESRCEIQYLQPARCSVVRQGSKLELRAD